MSWYIHHVNLEAHDVAQTASFLETSSVLKRGSGPTLKELENRPQRRYAAYFGTENQGLHIVKAITSFAHDNNFVHNPTIGGHFAVCVPDIQIVKKRLETLV